MKTLLIGFYDFPYGATARELTSYNLHEISLSNNMFHRIAEFAERRDDTAYSMPQSLRDLFALYSNVILCNDGEWEVLK